MSDGKESKSPPDGVFELLEVESVILKMNRRVWRTEGPKTITVEDVVETLELHLKRRTEVPNWFPIAGVIFIAFAVVAMWASLANLLPFADKQQSIFNAFVALCVAAGSSFLGGQAIASGRLPASQAMKENPINFSLAGGVAVFVIVLILMFTFNK